MAKLTIYGGQNSRAGRVTWCARELGLEFEQIDIPRPDLKKPEYLAVNPNGKIPAMRDGDVVMFESLAINLYLAKTYGLGTLYPKAAADEAKVLQWSFWAAAEVEPNLMPALLLKLGFADDEAAAKSGVEKVKAPLTVLNAALEGKTWLLGENFTVADINAGVVANLTRGAQVDISYAPNVAAWLARCNARPHRNPPA